jgi:hypothetical protein
MNRTCRTSHCNGRDLLRAVLRLTRYTINLDTLTRLIIRIKPLDWFFQLSLFVIIKARSEVQVSLIVIIKQGKTLFTEWSNGEYYKRSLLRLDADVATTYRLPTPLFQEAEELKNRGPDRQERPVVEGGREWETHRDTHRDTETHRQKEFEEREERREKRLTRREERRGTHRQREGGWLKGKTTIPTTVTTGNKWRGGGGGVRGEASEYRRGRTEDAIYCNIFIYRDML